MRTGLPAEGFLRHRGLILVAVGGAVTEGGLLTLLEPAARPIAPQVTAVPSLAAYHDLRWLFTDSQSWLWFTGLVAVGADRQVRAGRGAAPAGLAERAPGAAASRSFASCAALTGLAWLLLTPAATLAFGVAVLPFSWPSWPRSRSCSGSLSRSATAGRSRLGGVGCRRFGRWPGCSAASSR